MSATGYDMEVLLCISIWFAVLGHIIMRNFLFRLVPSLPRQTFCCAVCMGGGSILNHMSDLVIYLHFKQLCRHELDTIYYLFLFHPQWSFRSN